MAREQRTFAAEPPAERPSGEYIGRGASWSRGQASAYKAKNGQEVIAHFHGRKQR